MADEKLTALTATTTAASTDIVYVVVDPGTTPVSKKSTIANLAGGMDAVTYAALKASQLINEIKNWPPDIANDADLVTLNLWWDDVATPTTKATFVDVAGEAGLTATYQYALKCVGDGAGDGLQQIWTYADEPRVKSGRVMSALVAIWSVGGISITAKLVNSDASETAASAVTAAAWTIVEIPNHTLAGTTCSLQITAGAAGTFYVVPLGANIGARGFSLPPRPRRYVDVTGDVVLVNGVDPGGATTDVDCSASTSNLCIAVYIGCAYTNATTAGRVLRVRRNGSTQSGVSCDVCRNPSTTVAAAASKRVAVDDGNIFEYFTNGPAGDTETVTISLQGWDEWG